MIIDKEILAAAFVGYEIERGKVEQRVSELRTSLGVRPPGRPKGKPTAIEVVSASSATKRKVSAAARKRMAAAQRKRWAAYKEAKKAAK
jgi:hypothetical protein